MTTSTEAPKTTLDEIQVRRHEAAQAARKILVASGPFTSTTADVIDVITLAEWILEGHDEPEAPAKPLTVDDSYPFPQFDETGEKIWCGACKEWHPLEEGPFSRMIADVEKAFQAGTQGGKAEDGGTPIVTKTKKRKGRDA